MAVIILYELSNVFIVGPVSSTIAEVLAPLQEDISAVMAMTNDRAPFFSLQVQFNEEVGRILSNVTVNIKISYLQTKANICEDFKQFEMDNEIDTEWTVGKDSKPNHIQSCEREYAEELTCPACLMSPITWGK